ncbi:MAG TPA: hypothetical protein VGE24_12555, partial [Emticicia sp.]
MSEHVFSYHKSKVDGEHWFSSIPYKATEIEKILDTEGGDNERQPTSIPSPFARIDLVGTSLLNLSKTANLLAEARIERSLRKYIATKNDERIVSALFDIGEILFNYDNFKERIKISVWNARFRDKNVEGTLSTLTGSELYGLRELGETIKLFLTSASDRKAYNFRDNNTFYIIKFDGKIIGGTSPSTFFFPSSNESQLKELDIDLGTHKAFKEIVPLYNRDLEYQKVWYALLEKNNTYKQNFLNGGFDQYIQKSAKIQEKKGLYTDRFRDSLPDYWTQKDDQNQQEGNNRENHFIIAGTDKVEVLGIRIIKRFVGDKIVPIKSDFKIQAKPTYKGALPLALSFSNHGDLTIKDTTTWENKGYTKDSIPYYDERRINDRTIPGFPDRYPCIYVTDLLEDYLVRVNYPINNQFFNSSSNTSNKGFLLPLKKEFFEYFSIDDIRKEKVRIKIEPPSPTGTVKVQLDIPISVRGNFTRYINFEKNYFNQKDALPDKKINKGILIESRFSLSIYPFIKFPTDITPDYRIQVMEMGNTSVDLKFESETSSDSGEITFRNTNKSVITASSKYIQLQNSFEYISVVANNEYNGIIIPELITPQPGNATFNFAIDFGTTN